jgi:hypothetical protein
MIEGRIEVLNIEEELGYCKSKNVKERSEY